MEKHLAELIKRIVGKHFGVTPFNIELEMDEPFIRFSVDTVNVNTHTVTNYRGFLGTIGNLFVTAIDGELLEKENYIDLT